MLIERTSTWLSMAYWIPFAIELFVKSTTEFATRTGMTLAKGAPPTTPLGTPNGVPLKRLPARMLSVPVPWPGLLPKPSMSGSEASFGFGSPSTKLR